MLLCIVVFFVWCPCPRTNINYTWAGRHIQHSAVLTAGETGALHHLYYPTTQGCHRCLRQQPPTTTEGERITDGNRRTLWIHSFQLSLCSCIKKKRSEPPAASLQGKKINPGVSAGTTEPPNDYPSSARMFGRVLSGRVTKGKQTRVPIFSQTDLRSKSAKRCKSHIAFYQWREGGREDHWKAINYPRRCSNRLCTRTNGCVIGCALLKRNTGHKDTAQYWLEDPQSSK